MAAFADFWLTTRDGLRVYARDYDHAAAAYPVLCLHGLTRNSADFEDLADVLAPRYRMVVMEQRGRGRSDYDPNPANYHVGTYVQDALALIDAMSLERPALVGTSMGGLMSMMMAGTTPQRFRGVVLNDIGPVVEPAGLARIRGYVGRGGPVADWDEAVQAVRLNNEAAFPHLDDGEWLAFARRLFREAGSDGLEPAYDPAIAEPMKADTGTASGDPWSVFDGLAGVPLLVIRGVLSDILSAETVAEMARRHSGLRRVEVAERGHAPLLSEPEAVDAICAFLAGLED